MLEKRKLFAVNYSICDYESASDEIIQQAHQNHSFGVSALAVHGLIESVKDQNLGELVNKIDLVVPDGQPIRWALNSFYKVGLKDRVYGPTLTKYVLEKANRDGLKVYLYGSTETTITKFRDFINRTYPQVIIAGIHVDRFRVLVGRGCPRQERWVANHLGKVNAAMMAVGAAFDFHAGTVKQAPAWMQKRGLEWFFRLTQEPKRLWRRYLFTNSHFVYLFFMHKLGLKKM
jgi:N-acetylglucosaminyldiphosphoundecaprenol N-acetyl-beta-D-mannosaminyltransferase